MTLAAHPELSERLIACIDEQRLVDTACAYVSTPSPTGAEQAMAETVRSAFVDAGLNVSWQEVEDGRPNVIGTAEGQGGGPTLMFNGHMDTSYSGREPHLRHIFGFQPEAVVKDGRIYGLGISNMKGALACYLEAVRAIKDAGVTLKGDVLIACVVGEIEKTQWGEEFRGAEYRGYAAGSRYLATHGGIADMCILGEPTEQKVVLGHFGTMWARISTHGPFIHTAFSTGRQGENSIIRMREVLDDVLEWIPQWEERGRYRDRDAVVNVGAISG
ncbi:MAG: M20/M25/M40 family metallo-hydrolase, partial [Solirubrobacterales bacterium]|nr:M20/M25/M40 family metallo-hydrolase [Solirubrobacterales bacterium]